MLDFSTGSKWNTSQYTQPSIPSEAKRNRGISTQQRKRFLDKLEMEHITVYSTFHSE
jgi:hypothetical protein